MMGIHYLHITQTINNSSYMSYSSGPSIASSALQSSRVDAYCGYSHIDRHNHFQETRLISNQIKKFTFMKIASPLGTLSNISPPTCSTPGNQNTKRINCIII